MTNSDFRYYAFISYSHRDKQWGDWLHKSLETYRVPARLVGQPSRDGKVPARIAPIFRDREELPTASDLSNAINDALEQSRYLIVICSPNSAKSRWVDEEILQWKRMGKANRILCLIVDGEPNASDSDDSAKREQECFPPSVRFEVGADGNLSDQRAEPIAADARDVGDNKRDAKLKLIAGLLGVGFDSLKQREMQRRNRRMAAIAIAATVLLAVTTTLAVLAIIARGQAEDAQQLAEQSERGSRRMLVNTSVNNGWREYDNANPLTAVLWHAQALKQIESATSLQPEDELTARHARIRLHFLLSHLPVPELAVFHDTPVVDAKWSADGSRIVTASIATARVWDAKTGQQIGKAVEHTDDANTLGAKINFVEISPDGKWLATGADSDGIRISHAETGEVHIRRLDHKEMIPFNASFSPDSKRLATAVGQSAIIWDVATGKPALPPLQHQGGVGAVVFSPDGKWIATGGSDKVARFWDATTGEALGIAMMHENAANDLAWSEDSRRIVTWTYDGRARVWEAPSGKPLTATLPSTRVVVADLSANGERVALISSVVTRDGEVNVYDVAKAEKPVRTVVLDGIGKAVDLSADGQTVAVAYDVNVDVIDLKTLKPDGKPTHVLPSRFGGNAEAVRFSPDETRLLVGDSSGVVRVSKITGRRYQAENIPLPLEHKRTEAWFRVESINFSRVIYGHHPNEVFAIRSPGMLVQGRRDENGKWTSKVLLHYHSDRFNTDPKELLLYPDGKRVLTCMGDTVWLIDPATKEAKVFKEPKGKDVHSIVMSPDGKWLLMISNETTIWNLHSDQVGKKFLPKKGRLLAAFSNDSKRLIVTYPDFDGASQTLLQIWDTNAWDQPKVEVKSAVHPDERTIGQDPGEQINQPVMSLDGKVFAVSQPFERVVTIRSVETGESIGAPMKNNADVLQTTFVPNTNLLMTRDGSSSIVIWDLATRKPIVPPLKIARDLGKGQFSSDGHLMCTTGFKNVRLWDTRLGQRVWPALWQSSVCGNIAFNPANDRLLVTSKQGWVWRIQALDEPADELLMKAQWHAQQRIDPTGAAVEFRSEESRELWDRMRDLSQPSPEQ